MSTSTNRRYKLPITEVKALAVNLLTALDISFHKLTDKGTKPVEDISVTLADMQVCNYKAKACHVFQKITDAGPRRKEKGMRTKLLAPLPA